MLTGLVVEPNPYLAKGERERQRQNWPFFSLFGCQQSYSFCMYGGSSARYYTCTSYDTAYYRRSNGSLDGSHKSLASYKYVAQAGTEPASSSTSEKVRHVRHLSWGPPHLHARVLVVASDRKSRPEFPIQFFFSHGWI